MVACIFAVLPGCNAGSVDSPSKTNIGLSQECGLADNSLFCRTLKKHKSFAVKLSSQLTLEIPSQYTQFWLIPDAPASKEAASLPLQATAFSFFLPDFSGYRPDNYQTYFDDSRVDVLQIRAADPRQTSPNAPGEYPPNMISRSLTNILDPEDYKDAFGLRCYNLRLGSKPSRTRTCYGVRDSVNHEEIYMDVDFPPFDASIVNPLVRAKYYSSRYGGMTVAWRTSEKNFAKWREIDEQIWRFVDAWKIGERSAQKAP
jgi:hypothetical protein